MLRLMPLPIFVAAVALGAPHHRLHGQMDSVIESSSKRAFPTRVTVPGREASHVLAGTAIRTKTFLKVQVYAYGVYVDGDGARAALSAWRGKTAEQLKDDAAFYDALLQDSLAKTLRLHMTRDVGGDDMADAFDDALGPRVDAAAGRGMAGGRGALTTFRGYFDVGELTKESILTFSCLPGGTLLTSVNGELREPLQSVPLCWALFDVYLGRDPIMKKGKKTVVQRLHEVLR